MPVGNLWMLRPWIYASDLLPLFPTCTSVEGLRRRLRDVYPNLVALEEIAARRSIPIYEPFQGVAIGAFQVLAPSPGRYIQAIVDSERTPESTSPSLGSLTAIARALAEAATVFVRAGWGAEAFSPEETSAENEMSVIQYATLCGEAVLLTGDAGRGGLREALDHGASLGLSRPSYFQAPHHGSRRNVSTELLDSWLGPRLPLPTSAGGIARTAMISSAKEDPDHPRKAVVRALIHRGARVYATEGRSIRFVGGAAPARHGWSSVSPEPYPESQEEE